MVAVHVHPPSAAGTQVTDAKPRPWSGPPIPSQVVVVPESIRHEGASANCSVPVVVVISEYVPSALAVHEPLTVSDPVAGAGGQLSPASVRSCSPVTFKHDDVTFQVPTTLPPQGATFEHEAAPPPAPVFPVLPPVPDWGLVVVLQAAQSNPNVVSRARTADWTLVERISMTSLVG
jgi:hypothetical protein